MNKKDSLSMAEYERRHLAITCEFYRITPVGKDRKGEMLYSFACTKLGILSPDCPCEHYKKRLLILPKLNRRPPPFPLQPNSNFLQKFAS